MSIGPDYCERCQREQELEFCQCPCCSHPRPFWNPHDGYWECDSCGGEVVGVDPNKPKIYPEMEYF